MRTLTAVVVALVLLAAGAITRSAGRRMSHCRRRSAPRPWTATRKRIKQFGDIAEKYKSDRATVAHGLVHLAGCYQKRGDAQAKCIYERIVREFGDQKDAVDDCARAAYGQRRHARRAAGNDVPPGVGRTREVADDRRNDFARWPVSVVYRLESWRS